MEESLDFIQRKIRMLLETFEKRNEIICVHLEVILSPLPEQFGPKAEQGRQSWAAGGTVMAQSRLCEVE